jgi:putative membrane protein
MTKWTRPAIAGMLLTAAAVGACKKDTDSNGAVDSTKTAMAPDTAKPAAATTTPAPSKWTSPSVIGYAWAANTGEVELGKLGQKKATNAQVKAFAKQMVTDHSAMLADGKALAAKLNAMPDTTADDARDLMGHGRDEIKDLTDKAAGADWDKNYMDKMVDDHQKVLDKLQDAAKNTTDPELTKALEAAVGKVQTHLTKAQDIRAKLP